MTQLTPTMEDHPVTIEDIIHFRLGSVYLLVSCFLVSFFPSPQRCIIWPVFPDKTESLPPNNGEILSCVKTHQTSSSLYLH